MITKMSKYLATCLASVAFCGAGTLACSRKDEAWNSGTTDRGTATLNSSGDERKDHDEEIFLRGVPLAKARALGFTGIDELESAARTLPTLESCLVSDRAGSEALTINWDKIGSEAEARVCLTRVATRLGGPESIKTWLTAHKFIVTSTGAAEGTAVSLEAEEQAGTTIEASWPIDKNGPLLRRGTLTRMGQQSLGYNVNVLIFVSQPSGHVSVGVVTNIL